ncbi:MAG: hypothetical protein IKE04_02820 [Oscillospiraceae bacterium]|nr:hypothetical protein [Oscillospiraceae bacterium]
MDLIALRTSSAGRQSRTITISPNGRTVALRLELRFLCRNNRWYLSIADGLTGAPLVQYIPLVACTPDALNNLLRQFAYLGLGGVWVLNKNTEASGKDPAEDTLSDFEIIWGDADD